MMNFETVQESLGNVFVESPGGVRNTQPLQEQYSYPFDTTRSVHGCDCGQLIWNNRPPLGAPTEYLTTCNGLLWQEQGKVCVEFYGEATMPARVYTHVPFETWKWIDSSVNPIDNFSITGAKRTYDYLKDKNIATYCKVVTTEQNIYFPLFKPYYNWIIKAVTNVYNNSDWGTIDYQSNHVYRFNRNKDNCNRFNDEYFWEASTTPARNSYLHLMTILEGFGVKILPNQQICFNSVAGFCLFNKEDLEYEASTTTVKTSAIQNGYVPETEITRFDFRSQATLNLSSSSKYLGAVVYESDHAGIVQAPAAEANFVHGFARENINYNKVQLDSTFTLNEDCYAKVWVLVKDSITNGILVNVIFSGDTTNRRYVFDKTCDFSYPSNDIILTVKAHFIKKRQHIKYGFKFDRTASDSTFTFDCPWFTTGTQWVDKSIPGHVLWEESSSTSLQIGSSHFEGNAVFFNHVINPPVMDYTSSVWAKAFVFNSARQKLLTNAENYETWIISLNKGIGSTWESELPRYNYNIYTYYCDVLIGSFWKESVPQNTLYGFQVEAPSIIMQHNFTPVVAVGADVGGEVVNYDGEENSQPEYGAKFGSRKEWEGSFLKLVVDNEGFNTLMLEENYPRFTETPILNITLT